MLLGLCTVVWWRLVRSEGLDPRPAMARPEPPLLTVMEQDHGPVLVTAEYRVDPGRLGEFAAVMQRRRLERHRDGAMRWSLYADPADLGRCLEMLLVESWLAKAPRRR